MKRIWIALCVTALIPVTAQAGINVGSDGTDGPLTVVGNGVDYVIDLSQATTGAWDAAGNSKGVYDPAKWAVVFKYSSVNIVGGNVKFRPHPSGAPVVWLVQGNVKLGAFGIITLDGDNGQPGLGARGGPGGFRGGLGNLGGGAPGGDGMGPGGGRRSGHQGGVYADTAGGLVPYGNGKILPLIGGSGGSGSPADYLSGGGGGGAILIAANDTVSINGQVTARGGANSSYGGPDASGSGGAIRIIADIVTGSGILNAVGGVHLNTTRQGGGGRIRVESNSNALPPPAGSYSVGTPDNPPQIWPPATTPLVTVTAINGVAVPADPSGSFSFPPDAGVPSTGPITLTIQGQNVPANWIVIARAVPSQGNAAEATAVHTTGDTWLANFLSLPTGFLAFQVTAKAP